MFDYKSIFIKFMMNILFHIQALSDKGGVGTMAAMGPCPPPPPQPSLIFNNDVISITVILAT